MYYIKYVCVCVYVCVYICYKCTIYLHTELFFFSSSASNKPFKSYPSVAERQWRCQKRGRVTHQKRTPAAREAAGHQGESVCACGPVEDTYKIIILHITLPCLFLPKVPYIHLNTMVGISKCLILGCCCCCFFKDLCNL